MILRDEPDELLWGLAQNGTYSPKDIYKTVHARHKPEVLKCWWWNIWKLHGPLHTQLLMWNIISEKILTGTNLRKREFLGPTWCVLCKDEEETTKHIFLTCPITQHVWAQVLQILNIPNTWIGDDMNMVWNCWWDSATHLKAMNFPLIVSWRIWIFKNNNIFQGKQIVWAQNIPKICKIYLEIPEEAQVTRRRNITPKVIDRDNPWAFFDGAAQEQGCGEGIILHITETYFYHTCVGLGDGTNNYVDLITL